MSYKIFNPPEPMTIPWSDFIPGRRGYIWVESVKYRTFFLRHCCKWQNENNLHGLLRMLDNSMMVELGKIIA